MLGAIEWTVNRARFFLRPSLFGAGKTIIFPKFDLYGFQLN